MTEYSAPTRCCDHPKKAAVVVAERWSSDPALKHRELVAKDDDLEVFGDVEIDEPKESQHI
jgi:hypothetical protein